MISIKILHFANLITMFGSNILKIPFSFFLAEEFGVGSGFALFIIIQMLPIVLFSASYSKVAQKFGIFKTIQYSQGLSILLGAALCMSLFFDLTIASVFILFLLNTTSSCLKVLFPGLLKEYNQEDGQKINSTKKHLADWSIISNLALVCAIMLGGLLKDYISLQLFICLDVITFIVSYLFWVKVGDTLCHSTYSIVQNFHLKTYVKFSFLPINQMSFFRSVAYGVFNSFIPVIIVTKNGLDSKVLGLIYLYMGVVSIFGSVMAKKIKHMPWNLMRYLVSLELLIMASTIYFSGFYHYIALVFFLLLLTCFNQINLHSELLNHCGTKNSSMAAAAYSMVTQWGVLLSFLIYFFFSKQVSETTFILGVLGCSIISFMISFYVEIEAERR